jgi:hypothetical protein
MEAVQSSNIALRAPRKLPSLRPLLLRLTFSLLIGSAITFAIVFALSMWGAPEQGMQAEAYGPHRGREWHLTTFSSTGSMRLISQHLAPNWGAWQATGPPDTLMGGDSTKAWCPATSSGRMEWLILDYPEPVIAREVSIYENYDPGALVRVTLFNDAGEEIDAWAGKDPTPKGTVSGISKIPLTSSFKTKRIKVYFDSLNVPGWNEVDAVGLTDDSGKTWWACGVEESSSYGSANRGGMPAMPSPSELLPSWCPADTATKSTSATETRIFEARGWPMLATWTERDLANSTMVTGGMAGTAKTLSGYRLNRLTTPVTLGLTPVLPYRPIWPGLLFNSIFYAVFAAAIFWLLTKPRRMLNELLRMRRGCCIACGYELDFDFKSGCPECGWRRAKTTHSPSPD